MTQENQNQSTEQENSAAPSSTEDVAAIDAPEVKTPEQEIAELEDEDRMAFLQDLGLDEAGLDKLVKACYHLLDLISFLTAGPQEIRAWTIRRGTKAPQAAGKIHSDIERGFIRAETIAYDDLIAHGTMSAAKEKGLVRLEGKEYEVKDGDVILFRFNV